MSRVGVIAWKVVSTNMLPSLPQASALCRPVDTTPASYYSLKYAAFFTRTISSSASTSTEGPSRQVVNASPTADPFHDKLRSKTEQELVAIIMKNRESASTTTSKESEKEEDEVVRCLPCKASPVFPVKLY
jgi:hypothetical protein